MSDIQKRIPEDIAMKAERRQRGKPVISEEEYQGLLDLRTGRDSFLEFKGFVLGENGKKSFKDIYRVHDEFPELGSNSNLAITLTGTGSNLPREAEPKSIVDFQTYSIHMSVGRPLQEMPGSKAESTALTKSKKTEEPQGAALVGNPISFELQPGQTLKEREAARDFLRGFTRELLEEILKRANDPDPTKPSYENLLEKHADELKERGVFRIFTKDGLIDFRDGHSFRIEQ